MALFASSTPQCMKDKKLYDEDSKFTDDDLDDVLQGLLKLGVSDSNNNNLPPTSLQKQCSIDSFQPLTTRLSSSYSHTPLSTNPKYRSSSLSLSSKSNPSLNRKSNTKSMTKSNTSPNPYLNLDQDITKQNNKSPNRHSPLYKQQASFIVNSKQVKQQRLQQFAKFYSLMAAVNTVEKRDVFKIDIADINRITATYTPDDVDCVWDKETRTLKRKSKNAISVPHHNNDYNNDYFNTSFQFSF